MKLLKGKTVVCILLVLALSAGFYFIVGSRAFESLRGSEHLSSQEQTEAYSLVIDNAIHASLEAASALRQYIQVSLSMSCAALEDSLAAHPDAEPMLFESSLTARFEDGKLQLPEGTPAGFPTVTREMLDNPPDTEPLTLDSPMASYYYSLMLSGQETDVLLNWRNITGNWYYFEWTPAEDEDVYIQAFTAEDEDLNYHSLANGTELLILSNDDQLTPVFSSMELTDMQAGQLGITRSMLQIPEQMIRIESRYYMMYTQNLPEDDEYIIVSLVPENARLRQSRDWASLVTAVVFICLCGISVWLLSLQKMVRDNVLTEKQKKKYRPARVRATTAAVGLIAVLGVLAGSSAFMLLGNVQSQSENNSLTMDLLRSRLKLYEERQANIRSLEDSLLNYYATHAAELLSRSPASRNTETLRKMKEAVGGDSLSLFDAKGFSMADSEGYANLTLGKSDTDPMYDFRRLNTGIPFLLHPAQTDALTGKELVKVGARVVLEGDHAYGALILSMDPEKTRSSFQGESLNDVLSYFVPSGQMILAVNPETDTIVNASDPDYANLPASYTGLGKDSWKEAPMQYYSLFGDSWFGCTSLINGHFYSLMRPSGTLSQGLPENALLSSGLFALAFLLLSTVLLADYTRKSYDHYAQVGVTMVEGPKIEVWLPDGRKKKTVDPSRRWALFSVPWRDKFPEQKTVTVVRLLIGFALILLVWQIFQAGRSGSSSLLGFVIRGEWVKGFNVFALTSILLMIIIAQAVLQVVRLILGILANVLGSKGETVCRLVYNICQYAALLTVLFLSFSNLGIDTTALLAGVSLLSLAISLGSRDLVADVLAGLFIVFEGEYQVGDMVEIAGYWGIVQEIGVRSTKLIGEGNNIKIIANRNVTNVVNKSRLNSWCIVDLGVPLTAPLEEIEEMMNRRLPEIAKAIPQIISGPYFRGVQKIAGGTATLSIGAECRETDLYLIQRQMNRRLWEIMREEGFPLS